MSREIAEKVAWSLHGLPYRWGGDDPIIGFDCSGFCVEILKSVGVLPRDGDWTAQGLWERFISNKVGNPYNGCLAFWRGGVYPYRITHVEYCLSELLTMGASGGGSKTIDIAEAIASNAFIKVRPLRADSLYGFADPFIRGIPETLTT